MSQRGSSLGISGQEGPGLARGVLALLLPVLLWWRSRGRSATQAVLSPAKAGGASAAQAAGLSPDGQPLPSLRLLGRNRGESIDLAPGQFICAQAQQNHVNLVWWTGAWKARA